MEQGKLTHAWTKAPAALPLKWRLMRVVAGPREADPVIRSESWVAWARGPKGERVEGHWGFPERALHDLAETLRTLS
jgi:hypothetical protein